MNAEEYRQWREHPLTVAFHQFMMDHRVDLMEKWARGNYASQSMEQMAMFNSQQMGRAMMLADLCDLADDAIAEFYRQQPKEESDVPADQETGG